MTNAPQECFPRDQLTAEDLLPNDAANSKFAQVMPAGQGDVDGRNYLTSTEHFGIDTVGNSLKNPSYDLRGDVVANPQIDVSPWNKSTISSDLLRKPLQ